MEETPKVNIAELAEGYDGVMFNPAIYDYLRHSDFMNYGYWESGTRDQKEACEKLVEKLFSFIPDKRGSILDVACGKGATTRHLMKYYAAENITGINISEKQLATARANAPGCTFLVMNATELEFKDASFDSVICVEAAFHFDTREKFFREAVRVLKPGGYLVLSDILMNREAERRRKFRTEKNYVRDLAEYREVVRRAGFQDGEVIDATEPCWKGHFWNAVCYFHKKFFSGEIDGQILAAMLENTYRVAPDIDYYVLLKARK
jgi:ubiquinone/menaquinone biosynthesis C-methylase UbiE